jgi:GT2 family glycosyltransferase
VARICAVVVTCNRKDLLRTCLRSLIAQTRPVDRILVVDNASTDGTAEMLDTEFASLAGLGILARLTQKENMGGASAVSGGMRWAHCNKFDWVWVMDDGVELAPDCLRRMLAFEDSGDLIQVHTGSDTNPVGPPFVPVQHCDFAGALIRKKIIEDVGFPDLRYFNAADDMAYGYLASQRARSICLNYAGIIRHVPDVPPLNRATFYLSIRNRFLNRDILSRSGASLSAPQFFFQTLVAVVKQLSRAFESPTSASVHALATIDGLRDGLHKRFDRLPQS